MKNIYILRKPICLFLATFFVMQVGWGQVSISAGTTITQDFDAVLGTSAIATWTNNSTVAGWYITSTSLPLQTGSSNSNNVYNCGVLGISTLSDRALGAVSTATTHRFGLRLRNSGATNITSFSISFTGEQWRSFNAGTLVFDYQTGTTVSSLTSGTWTAASAFDFVSLQTSGGSALDGNASANRTSISGTLTVSVPSNTEIFFRWTRSGSSSPCLAIDDLSITANGASALTSPTITAASSPTVDAPFNVTFTDDPTWRGAITSITIAGTTLSASAYSISAGQITFTPSASTLLQSAGSKSIVVIATGYSNATVSQSIGAGIANKLSITTQPTAPSTNGGTLATQPKISIQDQYGNATTSTASINAAVGAGIWTLGGTTSVNAISGTTTFAGLTATSTNAVSGATITFTSTGLTSVTSNTFNIAAPAPSNDLCNNSTSLTNGTSTSGTTISATYSTLSDEPYTAYTDVWYIYTAIASGTVTVQSTNSASIDYDLFAYATNCPTAAAGIGSSATSSTSSETMTFTATSGVTYYIRVVNSTNTIGSTFTLVVNQPLSTPIISSSSNVTCSSFDANWSSVNTATDYKLDVATNNFPTNSFSENFENTLSLFTNTGGTYYTGNSLSSELPASSPFNSLGSYGFGVSNGTAILTSSNINTSSNTNIQLSFKLASFSTSGSGNGADAGDIVTVEISPDGGVTYYSTLRILGNINATWPFTGGLTALTAYDGNTTPVDYQPSASATSGYSTINITNLPAVSNLKVRITLLNNHTSERWVIDNFSLTGNSTPNYLSGYQDLSVSSTSKTISGLSPNTKYYYRVRSTDGTNTSASSNVDSITTPALSMTTAGTVSPICYNAATSSSLAYSVAADNPNSYSIDWNSAANTAGLSDQTATSFTSSASGGTISSIAIPSNVPAGNYSGVMTITNAAGCSITKNISLTINALPSISITSSPSSAIVCSGSSVSLTATAGLSSYAWSSGSSTTNSATFSPTTTTTYTVTGTDANGCSATASQTVNYYPASTNATLVSSNVSGAVEQCTESDGYTYYADPASPGQYLFGIYKNGNSFTATVDITVDNVNKFKKSTSSNGANQEHASYTMSRYWNVNATGTVGTGVKVRFFVDPQDITDLLNARDNDYNTLKNTTNPSTFAVISGTENFKTVGTTYSPTNWTGNKYNGSIVKLTQDTVSTLNGQTYVELSGITSFSGGSIGAAFGPSSNGLFNSGGTVGLPVTWKDVKATVKEEGNLIQWITSSEKNTSHFEVEYSYDAKNFMTASRDIKAAGNSTTSNSYEYTHLEEFGEMVYYRIKQIDRDGKIDYSKIVNVKRSSKLPEFQVSMYPIPLNTNELNLKIQTVQKTDITITINDLLGRGVYTERVSPQGYTTDHKLSLGHLQNGTYHVTIDNGMHKSVQVLVVGK